ncbi:MAG: histidine kinase [Pseudomonadota bacterium]
MTLADIPGHAKFTGDAKRNEIGSEQPARAERSERRGWETPFGEGPFVPSDGRTRRAMNWFFANKSRLFWILQLAGWVGFFVFHMVMVSSLVAGFSPASFDFSASSSLIGFLSTSFILRPVLQYARKQAPFALLSIAIGATLLLAVAMSAAKAIAFQRIFGGDWLETRVLQLGTDNLFVLLQPDVPVNLFLLVSWGGFYFGVNYYLTLRDETQRAIQSARLAEQAQLKMLRYQLNPHFLFNTLNAVSTLVLTKDSARANEMLTKLSAFLRYSLDSDPLQKTTLSEELRALDLYLDIETTRFGDRLTIVKDVDEAALSAQVPSLILQPAIENAIKYAVGRMEEGGEILIIARQKDDTLVMEVCDNGPNAPDDPEAILIRPRGAGDSGFGAGVGLINMRDRLVHLYGEAQSFNLSRRSPAGFRVTLELPFQT